MVLEKITEVLVEELGIEASEVSLEKKIADDLGADSLAIMNIVMELEEIYDLTIPEEEIYKLSTVNDIVVYITENKA